MGNAHDGGFTFAERKKFRVFLVDDHPALLLGVSAWLQREPDLTVCGTAGTPREALTKILALRPDVAVIDLALGAQDGTELIKDLRAQRTSLPVLVYSIYVDAEHARCALRAGANGYLVKEEIEDFVPAVRALLAGQLFLSDRVAPALAAFAEPNGQVSPQLSDRELAIYRLLGAGHDIKHIADLLGLSVKTVYTYCDRLCAKLVVPDKQALWLKAVREAMRGDSPTL